MPDEAIVPGRPRSKMSFGQGAPARPPKPVPSVGRYSQRLYCQRCGHLRTKCTCPLHEDTALYTVDKEAQQDYYQNPPDPDDHDL